VSDTWIDPPTLVTGAEVRNEDVWAILSNMQYLKNRPEADTIDFASSSEGDFTNTGAAQDAMPEETWSVALDCRGGDILVGSTIYFSINNANDILFSLWIDGVGQNGKSTYERQARCPGAGHWREARGVYFVVTGLSAGVHTFQLHSGTSANTLTIAGARRSNIWAIELQ